jgi:hypothetical protein
MMLLLPSAAGLSLLVSSSPFSISTSTAAQDAAAGASEAGAGCCMQLLAALLLQAPAVLLFPLKLVAPVSSDQPGDHCS